ncbi:phage tail family protein [Kitasatospora mediocidica]|uniref:phage tail family protein n=1 Tax=Kitasatospora mediocidica TaxID=58352 RepID=UPI00068FF196|nr:phage tail family protein [Kitasatospora mediocidica]
MTGAQAGQPWQLFLNFYSETTGALADPSSVTLDITYGQQVGFAPDVGGPYTYSGASAPTQGHVWRSGVGQYACIWNVPPGSPQGVYVANWTCRYGSGTFLGVEDFTVTGGVPLPVPSGDIGYWTGGILYGSQAVEFGQTDSNGITWIWRKIEGWDSPDVQGSGVIPRAGDHGAWASPQYFAARTLTLTVTASAPTQALRDIARTELQQAVPISDLAQLRYDEPVPKFAWIRRSGKVTEAYPTLTDVTFTVGLVAPDPRKYGTVQRSISIGLLPPGAGGSMVEPFTVPFSLSPAPPPGTSTATNAGSFPSPPVAVVAGPIAGPALTNLSSGQSVSWPGLTLNAGDVLVVDFLNRQGYVNPTSVSYNPGIPSTGGTFWPADVGSSWWQLAAGSNQVAFSGSASTGATASFYWHDSYV